MEIISLNIVTSYPVRWGKYQVIRDFVQNFYDAVGYDKWNASFHYRYVDGTLTMWIHDITFSYEWLLHIGASTKTANSLKNAGYFGEGFKIASLCAKRDYQWEINMQSGDWKLTVEFIDQEIDKQKVKMMAYNLEAIPYDNVSTLRITNFNRSEYEIFLDVLESFYYPENKIMGKKIWDSECGAVYMRSKEPILPGLPNVSEYGRKGAVFCGYQMLGTNPFGLVVCLHKYKKQDRERRTLYSFEVIHVFESVAYHIDSNGAMIMLEKMRRYWNSIPNKRIDIHSWSGVVNRLIRKVAESNEVTCKFLKKYPNLLYLKKVNSIIEKNQRRQAKSWLFQQNEKYILVKETFRCLGYLSLEELCETHGGFVEKEEKLSQIEDNCFDILEKLCKKLFNGFFIINDMWPKRRIIRNHKAAYHGMAVVYKNKKYFINNLGLSIRYHVEEIYLKSTIFYKDGFYDGLTTYVHELCHMFGGDSSNSFSLALTKSTEILLMNPLEVKKEKEQWKRLFN